MGYGLYSQWKWSVIIYRNRKHADILPWAVVNLGRLTVWFGGKF